LFEGRAHMIWAELLRLAATAVVPVLLGRWFGVAHLDARIGGAMLVVFGTSAVVVLWLAGRERRLVHEGHHALG
jgi:alkylglycerol monooxygenase